MARVCSLASSHVAMSSCVASGPGRMPFEKNTMLTYPTHAASGIARTGSCSSLLTCPWGEGCDAHAVRECSEYDAGAHKPKKKERCGAWLEYSRLYDVEPRNELSLVIRLPEQIAHSLRTAQRSSYSFKHDHCTHHVPCTWNSRA